MATSVCDGQSDSELMQANCTTQRKRHQLQGGFECVFVKDPSEHVQTECSVCLCVLRDPYLLDCCGYSFCKSCIEPVKSENKPCPLCAVQFTTCIPDKRLQRTLNDLQVYCSHKEEGCDWMGQLANLPQHLNVKPLWEADRLSGCQLTSIECKHCGDCFLRRDVVDHERDGCPQRPYICEYCSDSNSTFEDVTSNHWSVCPNRPVPCSNGCGLSPELRQLEYHVKECPLQVVECVFSYAGCNEKLPRNDMPEHIIQSLAIHMSLQATSHQQEQKKLNHRISELEIQLNEAKVEVAELRKANQLLLDKVQEDCKIQIAAVSQEIKTAQDKRLRGHLGTLRGEIKKAQDETKQEITKQVKSNIAGVHSHVGLVPFSVTMPGFEVKKRNNTLWYSSPFYTYAHGYKMCLRVDANGNGDGIHTHVSVFVYMMKGEYDDCLKWPFRGDITIQVLNQVGGDEGHRTWILNVTDVTDSAGLGDRVPEEKRCEVGLGCNKFIRHISLTPCYLKDDCLRLCVKEVKVKSL